MSTLPHLLPHRGFSMLDVIISISLAAILSVLIFQTLQQTTRTVSKIQVTVDVKTMLIHFYDRFFKDIQGTFVPQTPQEGQTQIQTITTQPQGQTPQKSYNYFLLERINITDKAESDHGIFSFVTTNALTIYDASAPRAVRIIYHLKKQPEKKTWQLLRSESTEFDYKKNTDVLREKPGIVILTNIESCEITAFASQTKQTPEMQKTALAQPQEKKEQQELVSVKTWNSDQRKQEKKTLLPEFIKMTGSVRDEKSKNSVPFSWMIPLETIAELGESSLSDQLLSLVPPAPGNII